MIKTILIKIYLTLAAKFTKNKKPNKIKDKFKLSMFDFCNLINGMPYKYDKLQGLMDNVAEPDTFFDDKDSDRDCDDWARMWSWWLTYNDYEAYEYCVCNPTDIKTTFKTMHAITVGKIDNKWWLFNYYYYGPFDTEEETLDYMKKFNSYKDNILIVKSPITFEKD